MCWRGTDLYGYGSVAAQEANKPTTQKANNHFTCLKILSGGA